MRIERVVVNASPLITLFRAELHPLLPRPFSELCVPDAVTARGLSGLESAGIFISITIGE
uniref:Uncharacterized protein n=1 Tax=Candidatus Kentrum sp. FW TaxID=2126338 RepID=A0A450SU78_9GAMM|nr:MAG: hypothetical protein BECKFW1821A_GA0114235_107213 [Candidatus Kentron sp. FW]VFJ62843.1 MAG: hypothetical protein BECKFW1821B_GA0114236_107713 [Candidatus Kentron sp. FW]